MSEKLLIDPAIPALAARLRIDYRNLLVGLPRYELDLSYPSVGVLDYICTYLKGKEDLNADDEALILMASAYIGGVVNMAWEGMESGAEVTLSFIDSTHREIGIRAKGGKHLPSRQLFSVNLTKTVRQVLQDTRPELSIFERYTRTLYSAERSLSLLTLGLCSGLTRYGDGPWATLSVREFNEPLLAVQRLLADSCAYNYQRLYPAERIGSLPPIYGRGVVLPPPGFEERFPYMRGASDLFETLKSVENSDQEKHIFLRNLCNITDDSISTVGLINLMARTEDEPSTDLLTLLDTQRWLLPAIRPAVLTLRTLMKRPADFLLLQKEGRFAEARQLFTLDRALGLLGKMHLTSDLLEDPSLNSLFETLVWRGPLEAIEKLQHLLTDSAYQMPKLFLQLGELQAALQDLPGLAETMKRCTNLAGTLSDSERSDILHLNGKLLALSGEFVQAEAELKVALSFKLDMEIAESYVEILTLLGRFEDIVFLRENLERFFPQSSIIATGIVHALFATNDADASEALNAAISRFPNNRSLFQILLQERVRDSQVRQVPEEDDE